MPHDVLVITDLAKAFEQPDGVVQVVDRVSLRLAPGTSAALTGDSGSGKTTLLQLAAGLLQPDSGSVMISGDRLTDMSASELASFRRRSIGLVFQQFRLIMTLKVVDNIRLMAALNDRLDPEYEAFLIDTLKLRDQLKKYPAQLSGGQQQRVGLARALNHKPILVLADEPTGSLDNDARAAVAELLLKLTAESGTTLLTATHSQVLADAHDRIIHLHNGQLTVR